MKALIYGHSQSGGMGLDLEKGLKKAGVAVKRITNVGYNDAKLLKAAPAQVDADFVFLYAGGNSDTADPEAIRKLVDHFGKQRTFVVLGPVSTAHAKGDLWRERNKGNVEGLKGYVPVYSVEAEAKEFWPDKLHMKPGAPTSVKLAQQILADAKIGSRLGSDSSPVLMSLPLLLLLGCGAFYLYATRR
jgi:hypothetical protein